MWTDTRFSSRSNFGEMHIAVFLVLTIDYRMYSHRLFSIYMILPKRGPSEFVRYTVCNRIVFWLKSTLKTTPQHQALYRIYHIAFISCIMCHKQFLFRLHMCEVLRESIWNRADWRPPNTNPVYCMYVPNSKGVLLEAILSLSPLGWQRSGRPTRLQSRVSGHSSVCPRMLVPPRVRQTATPSRRGPPRPPPGAAWDG